MEDEVDKFSLHALHNNLAGHNLLKGVKLICEAWCRQRDILDFYVTFEWKKKVRLLKFITDDKS